MTAPPRKQIRLDPESYAVPGTVWHISISTSARLSAFRDPETIDAAVESLRFQCRKAKAGLLVYCVMPDQVHAVISIAELDLIAIVRDFKSYTTRLWKQRTGQVHLWQGSFHDHGVRRSERMDDLVRYVLENPVKAGLVTDWKDYEWSGGELVERG